MYAKYCHATGPLLDRKKIEIEQTIPDRFESMVGLYREKLAIHTRIARAITIPLIDMRIVSHD